MEIQTLFGLLSVVITFFGYIPYTKDVLQNRTKPHVFSWLVWAILSSIAFGIQLTNNGGPGAWMMGFTAIATLIIFLLSLRYGEKNITRADRLSLSFAGFALALWFFTKEPLLSIILIAVVDGVGGYLPTFRKSFMKPHEETISMYAVYVVALVFSLAALHNFDLTNVLYPASFIAINLAMVIFLWMRRIQLQAQPGIESEPEAS